MIIITRLKCQKPKSDSFDNCNFKFRGDRKGFHNGGLYILDDQSNRYRGVLLPIPGVLVTGNLILCGSLFFQSVLSASSAISSSKGERGGEERRSG